MSGPVAFAGQHNKQLKRLKIRRKVSFVDLSHGLLTVQSFYASLGRLPVSGFLHLTSKLGRLPDSSVWVEVVSRQGLVLIFFCTQVHWPRRNET